MSALRDQRCLNHASRNAVAKCPACGHFFCRECITEHEHRLICAGCLRKASSAEAMAPPAKLAAIRRGVQIALGLLLLWLIFVWLGQFLTSIPDAFHRGVVWQSPDD